MDEMREPNKTGRKKCMEIVKKEFEKGPLAGDAVFGLLLVVLEKLVELEFTCPCKANFNGGFVATVFLVPAVLASVLMSTAHQLKCSCDKANVRNVLRCAIPAIVWMILLLLDGRYLACAKTDWSGRYVIADKAAPVKWCEPNSTLSDSTLSRQRLMKSEGWYFHSQWAGYFLIFIVAVVTLIIFKCTKQRNPVVSADHGNTSTPMEASSI